MSFLLSFRAQDIPWAATTASSYVLSTVENTGRPSQLLRQMCYASVWWSALSGLRHTTDPSLGFHAQ
ncbi:MAG: hypothetical protein INR62_10195 [Rhodospirillales bacterium]|nr:hypothetical protein [Acetobacter sp.]